MNESSEPVQGKEQRPHSNKYLTFTLGEESYGVEALRVREIIKLQEITPVPQMPSYVKGVINLRGKIIPVMDLRIKFELEKAESTDMTCIIVVHFADSEGIQTQMGLIVDGVEEVLAISSSEIEETPNFGVEMQSQCIVGMAKIKGSVKTLLDIDKVIGAEVANRVEQAAASGV